MAIVSLAYIRRRLVISMIHIPRAKLPTSTAGQGTNEFCMCKSWSRPCLTIRSPLTVTHGSLDGPKYEVTTTSSFTNSGVERLYFGQTCYGFGISFHPGFAELVNLTFFKYIHAMFDVHRTKDVPEILSRLGICGLERPSVKLLPTDIRRFRLASEAMQLYRLYSRNIPQQKHHGYTMIPQCGLGNRIGNSPHSEHLFSLVAVATALGLAGFCYGGLHLLGKY